jgi:peroxiredoxin
MLMSQLEIGDAAPDFTLRRTFDEDVSLAALRASGPVVVHFYVFDYGGI